MSAASREDGAVLVEFAIIVPFLLLLVVGMLQFGLLLNAWIDESHLTSSGARYAAVNQNPGADMPEDYSLQDYIKSRADTAGLRETAAVNICFPSGTSQVGDPVKVTMSYAYQLLPLIGGTLMTVRGDATMRLEAVPTNFTDDGPCS